jgi:ribonuclease P protein component
LSGEASPSLPPKIEGLRKRAQFLYVRHGRKAVRGAVIVEARKQPGSESIGFGLTASKKVGNAVIRNRARRRLREAAKRLLPLYGVAGADYVLVARLSTADTPWARLLDDLQNALIWLAAELEAPESAPSGRRKRTAPRDTTPLPNKGD